MPTVITRKERSPGSSCTTLPCARALKKTLRRIIAAMIIPTEQTMPVSNNAQPSRFVERVSSPSHANTIAGGGTMNRRKYTACLFTRASRYSSPCIYIIRYTRRIEDYSGSRGLQQQANSISNQGAHRADHCHLQTTFPWTSDGCPRLICTNHIQHKGCNQD